MAVAAPAVAEPAPAKPELLRDRAASQRPQLMVVGVSHFDNPGQDIVNVKVDDVLTPSRQAEMGALADALARFRPTHIAVEWPIAAQAKLDVRYAAYRAGTYTLTRDEVDQLGLRLAAMLGLPRVDAVDWNEMPPGTEADYDFEAYPDTPDSRSRLAALRDPKRAEADNARLSRLTLAGRLAEMNRPEHLAAMNQVYFDYAMIGDAKAYPGANWVGAWHGRNLKILSNLVRIAPGPSDRVLVIYGAGHAFLLNEFGEQSGAFKVVSPESLLRSADRRTR
jgi:hypothetical protein